MVEGNLIGTNEAGAAAVANGNFGIYFNASGATIGGTSAGGGNIIAFNDGPGIATEPGMTGATIRYNAIFSNAGPGIDLNNDGVTPNTPNGATNTPVLTSVAGGIISGTLNASPNSSYFVDFYANLTSDASPTRPQGRDYLTSTTVITNAAGDAVFNVPFTPFSGLPIFTATATNANGTTSEFSAPLAGSHWPPPARRSRQRPAWHSRGRSPASPAVTPRPRLPNSRPRSIMATVPLAPRRRSWRLPVGLSSSAHTPTRQQTPPRRSL